jgi:hypothetical protein
MRCLLISDDTTQKLHMQHMHSGDIRSHGQIEPSARPAGRRPFLWPVVVRRSKKDRVATYKLNPANIATAKCKSDRIDNSVQRASVVTWLRTYVRGGHLFVFFVVVGSACAHGKHVLLFMQQRRTE